MPFPGRGRSSRHRNGRSGARRWRPNGRSPHRDGEPPRPTTWIPHPRIPNAPVGLAPVKCRRVDMSPPSSSGGPPSNRRPWLRKVLALWRAWPSSPLGCSSHGQSWGWCTRRLRTPWLPHHFLRRRRPHPVPHHPMALRPTRPAHTDGGARECERSTRHCGRGRYCRVPRKHRTSPSGRHAADHFWRPRMAR